jgi:hypothetical protein
MNKPSVIAGIVVLALIGAAGSWARPASKRARWRTAKTWR